MEASPGVVMARAPWAMPQSERPGEVLAGEEAVEEAGGEGVAAADAVEDVEVVEGEAGAGLWLAKAKALQLLRLAVWGRRMVVARTLRLGYSATTRSAMGAKVSRVCQAGRWASSPRVAATSPSWPKKMSTIGRIDRLTSTERGTAAARLPERGAIVAVVADERAVATGGGDGLANDFGGVFRERGHDAAGVEDADAFGAEDGVPVDGAGLELGDGGVATVHHAEAGADAEAALEEVDAVAGVAAYAVEGLTSGCARCRRRLAG